MCGDGRRRSLLLRPLLDADVHVVLRLRFAVCAKTSKYSMIHSVILQCHMHLFTMCSYSARSSCVVTAPVVSLLHHVFTRTLTHLTQAKPLS